MRSANSSPDSIGNSSVAGWALGSCVDLLHAGALSVGLLAATVRAVAGVRSARRERLPAALAGHLALVQAPLSPPRPSLAAGTARDVLAVGVEGTTVEEPASATDTRALVELVIAEQYVAVGIEIVVFGIDYVWGKTLQPFQLVGHRRPIAILASGVNRTPADLNGIMHEHQRLVWTDRAVTTRAHLSPAHRTSRALSFGSGPLSLLLLLRCEWWLTQNPPDLIHCREIV